MKTNKTWLIGIDRGGTFTDVVAKSPDGELITFKLLSENPDSYEDAAIDALCQLLKIQPNESIPEQLIHSIRRGTTVATNALLERKGVPVCLVITKGFLEIFWQFDANPVPNCLRQIIEEHIFLLLSKNYQYSFKAG